MKKRLHEFVISKKQKDLALASGAHAQAFKHWLVLVFVKLSRIISEFNWAKVCFLIVKKIFAVHSRFRQFYLTSFHASGGTLKSWQS